MDRAKDLLCMGCMEKRTTSEPCPFCGFDPKEKLNRDYMPPGTSLDSRYILGALNHFNGESAVYIGYDEKENKPVWIHEYFPSKISSRDHTTAEIKPNPGCGAQYKSLLSDYIELSNDIRRISSSEPVLPVENMIGENNTVYVVFKHVESLSLEEYLVAVGGSLPAKKMIDLIMPLLNCVDNIHLSGRIHRGLSPYTIRVSSDGGLLLEGFALGATRTGESELKSELFSGYTAPEQYISTGWQGSWTDVYALASVIYRGISGIVPPKSTKINSATPLKTLKELDTDVSLSVSNAVQMAMEPNPQKRTQTVGALLSDILAEDGVPRTEIFSVNRFPVTFDDDDVKVMPYKNDNIKPLTPSENFDFEIDYRNETISQPIADLYEKSGERSRTKFKFDDATESELPSKNYEKDNSKGMPKWLIPLLIVLGIAVGVITAIVLSIKYGLVDNSKAKPSNRPSVQDSAEASPEDAQTTEDIPIIDETTTNTVPDLVGKKLDAVQYNPEYKDLYTFTVKEEYNDKYDAGVIAEQTPKAGKEMPKKGGTIVLTVSKGKIEMEMPDLAGKEPEEALQILAKEAEKLDIKFDEMKIKQVEKFDLNVEEGKIISTSPSFGDKFNPLEDDVIISIAKAPPASQSQQEPRTSGGNGSSDSSDKPRKGPNGEDLSPNIL